MWKLSAGFYRGLGGMQWGVYNTEFVLSEIGEANLQGMIYYIKNSKRIGRTCTHANVELDKFRAVYHHREIE